MAIPQRVLDHIAEAKRTGATSLDLSSPVLGNDESKLTELPENLFDLTQLTDLNLSNNQLSSLPDSITKLTQLIRLDLSYNQLSSLPDSVTKLTQLTYLNLSGNILPSFPESLFELTQLTHLYMSSNQLSFLPDSIGKLTRLMSLDLSSNILTSLPESLFKLTQLIRLDLSGNILTFLPESLFDLTQLISLNLTNNELSSLPDSIGKLTRLTDLNLSNNQLSSLPDSITKLTQLISLNLRNNELSSLLESLFELTQLTDLYLSSNILTSFPESLFKLTQLIRLDLRNNPLNIPPEIIDDWRNAQRILVYLRQLSEDRSANRSMNEAKVILVGEAKAGKTSLVKRLMDKGFDPNEAKTDGIDIHRWDLEDIRCTKSDGVMEEKTRTVRLNVWDLGGQEIYHATHQFFLTERTLYLLVLSARLTDEQNRLHYWLKTISALGKDAPILIVHNHHETNPEQLDRKTLREKYPAIVADGFIETSCPDETLKGINTLKRAISREIGQMQHVTDLLPPTYFAVKEQLEKETATRDFVSGAEYEKLCDGIGVTNLLERKSIIRLLHALGTVVSFQDDLRLRDTNVLNPEWVTEGVYSVLDDPELKAKGDGVLREDALPGILAGAKKHYPADKHSFILDMMERFELCFPNPGRRGEYLIPELLNKSEPDDIGDFRDALLFELQYDFLPQSILPRFIVRTSDKLQPYRWRKGVVIEHEGNRALVRADSEANKVMMAVTGTESTRRDMLSVLRDCFVQLHKSPDTLTVEEQIPLADYPNAKPIPYRHLRQLEAEGETNFHWLDVPEKLSVQQLLSGIERYRRVTNLAKGEVLNAIFPVVEKINEGIFGRTLLQSPALNRSELLAKTGLVNISPDNERFLNELADRVEKGRVVPFVGAGMTITLGMPGWVKALESIYSDAEDSLKAVDARKYGAAIATNAVEEAAQVLWDAGGLGEKWFNDRIKALFGSHKLKSPVTGAIALLPKFAQGPVLTTNFDPVLELVYKDAGQEFTRDQTVLGDYRAEEVIADWDEGKRFVLKLHGDASIGSGRVLTREQYDRAYGKGSHLPELLNALFGSRRPLLFLGCSLQTDRTLTELEKAGLKQSNAYHFALLEIPATEDERKQRQIELIQRYGIQPIWFGRGDFAAIERVLQFLVDVRAAR